MAKRFLLDPNMTAMENTFEAARVGTAYLLKNKRLKVTQEEWADLFDEIVYKAVQQFINVKVMQHQYNRNYSFYQNMFSCVWSVSRSEVRDWVTDNRRKISALSLNSQLESGAPVSDMFVQTEHHPLEHELPKQKRQFIFQKSELERFGLAGVYLKTEPELAFNAIWTLEDEDAELLGKEISADTEAHRDKIRERLDALPKLTHQQRYIRDYVRKRRTEKRKNG